VPNKLVEVPFHDEPSPADFDAGDHSLRDEIVNLSSTDSQQKRCLLNADQKCNAVLVG
jgi:hypothetical protein